VFFGLELMKDGFAPMKDVPVFTEAFAWFTADTYPGVIRAAIVGCVLTLIVQSSSATLGITIGLAATGVIPFTTAAALVLGENLGTTITALIASVGVNTNAKRAAYAHVLFNLFGVIWITALFPWYSRLIAGMVEGLHGTNPLTMRIGDFADPLEFAAVVTAAIALTHTGFNLANTALFLPFLGPYSRLLERIVPEPAHKEVFQLKHLDSRGVSSPVLGLEQSRGEVVQMGNAVLKMTDWIHQLAYVGPWDGKLLKKTYHREEILDNVQREIVAYITDILDATVPYSVAEEGRQQLRLAHEYESISDRLASVLRAFEQLRQKDLELAPEQLGALRELHGMIRDFMGEVTEVYEQRRSMPIPIARRTAVAITKKVRQLQAEHLQTMVDSPVDPSLSLVYAGMLTDYRRIRAHVENIHEAMVGATAVSMAMAGAD
jgi:phosphate:Na+ symporter